MTVTPHAEGSSGAPAQAPSMLDDVKAMIAEIEKPAAAAEGSGATPNAPAGAAQPAPAGAAAVVPPAEPPAATPPAPAEPSLYSDEELAAFDGEYDRRDFDWNRVDPKLRPRLKILESGTGKYRDRLRREREEERQRFEDERRASNPQPTPTQGAKPAPTPEQREASLQKFLNPETTMEGLAELLDSDDGRAVLQRLGYQDPVERQVISDAVSERIMFKAIDNASQKYPIYLKDATFQNEVTAIIKADPDLLKDARGRDEGRATRAWRTAMAEALANRVDSVGATFKTKETTLTAKEQDLANREKKLKEREEELNRHEGKTPSVGGGGVTPAKESTETTILEDARTMGRQFGMPW